MNNKECEHLAGGCMNCDSRSPLFCRLSREELEHINETRLTIVFRAGETIRKQGTYMSHVLQIKSGLAKVYLEGPGQGNSIIRIVGPGSFVGGPGIHYEHLHHYSVSALNECRVCMIDAGVFRELLTLNKDFAEEYLKDFSRNTLSVYHRLVNLTHKQMPGRMADSLIYVFREILQSDKGRIALSKQDLADLSGMAKESAVKILREFQRSGIVRIDGDELELLDAAALERISRHG